jgi:hypothetical protein
MRFWLAQGQSHANTGCSPRRCACVRLDRVYYTGLHFYCPVLQHFHPPALEQMGDVQAYRVQCEYPRVTWVQYLLGRTS